MNQKKRKLFSKIGATLMLGMSMFNFGAIWNKQRGGQIPKRARNIRKKQTEEVDPDVRQVAAIAEQEAQTILTIQQADTKESQQQLQEDSMTILQKFVRYAAISVWAFSMTVLFSSAIFNYPFSIGKGILSLLPGVPHVAKISLSVEKEYYKTDEAVSVVAVLDSNKEEVGFVKLVISYDPETLQFNDFLIDQGLFDSLEERIIDKRQGKIIVSMRNTSGGAIFVEEKIATFNFHVVKKCQDCVVKVEKDASVVTKQESDFVNILGAVSSTRFKVID